jgi:Biotin-requiring enzyme
MPRLSDSMEEGTILSWLKQVGDEVAVGDELVEIETDKANMAYESDVAGTLTEILAEEGETLPIGSPIARIGDGDSGEGPGAPPAGPVAAGEPPPPVAKASSGRLPRRRHPRERRRSPTPKLQPRRRRTSSRVRPLRLLPQRAMAPTVARGSKRRRWHDGWPKRKAWTSHLFKVRDLGGGSSSTMSRRRSPPARPLQRVTQGKDPLARHLRRARPRATSRLASPRSCNRRSPAAWPSRRRPRRTST